MPDKDDKQKEPQQRPDPGSYIVKTQMSGEYIAPDGHVVVSKEDAEHRA